MVRTVHAGATRLVHTSLAGLMLLSSAANAQSNASPSDDQTSSRKTHERAAAQSAPVGPQGDTPGVAASPSDIVVTATRRNERLIDAPLSITALGQDQLRRENADRFEDYVRTVPGLTFNPVNSNQASFSIRGVATATGPTNQQQTVGVYIDDLPSLDSLLGLTLVDLRLFDVNRVEVLRGPQGTSFGSGAMSGALRIITNKPDASRVQADAEATVSSTRYGDPSYALNAMVNVPVIADKLAVRVVGFYRLNGGYIDNITRNQRDVNRDIAYGGRLLIDLRLSPSFDLLATINHQQLTSRDSPLSFYSPGPGQNSLQWNGAVPFANKVDFTVYNLTGTYDFGFARLLTSTSYAVKRDNIQVDLTRLARAFGANVPTPLIDRSSGKTFVQEVRLTSTDSHPFRWLIGAFYLDRRRTYTETFRQPALIPFVGTDDIIDLNTQLPGTEKAVYGEASYYVTPKVQLTAGLRWFDASSSTSDVINGLLNGNVTSLIVTKTSGSAVTPKFSVAFYPRHNLTVYATAAKGYRVGQANFGPILGIPQSYRSDSLWSYEAGLKGRFLDDLLEAKLAGYYIDWRNIQIQVLRNNLSFITNAGNVKSYGGEAELSVRPSTRLTLSLAAALVDSRLTQDVPDLTQSDGIGAKKGDRVPGVPTFTISSSVDYTFPLRGDRNGFIRLEHQYIGKSYTDFTPAYGLPLGDYHIANVRLGTNDLITRVQLSAYVNNLFDSRGIANAVPSSNPQSIRVRPRTVGMTGRYQF